MSGLDVAIRLGPMRTSQLMARKLGQSRMAVVAARAYLARRGVTANALEGTAMVGRSPRS